MAEKGSYYSPASDYAFPAPYSVEQDEELYVARSSKYTTDLPFVLEHDPRDALVSWSKTSPGRWQAEQAARYPGFHRDLDQRLVPPEFEGREEDFKHRLLGAICFQNIHNLDHARFDLHPLGHPARVTVRLDRLLMSTILAGAVDLSPEMIDSIRHAAPVHDTAETEHPGVIVEHGTALGDISAAAGKTQSDKAHERAILVSLFKSGIVGSYPLEMRERMIKLISHEIDREDPEFIRAHGMLEIAHNLNSVATGIFLGNQASVVDPQFGNLMSALSEQHGKIIRPKNQKVFDHSPELFAPLAYTINQSMRELSAAAHCRDENPDFMKWRSSNNIVEVLGEYQPERWD